MSALQLTSTIPLPIPSASGHEGFSRDQTSGSHCHLLLNTWRTWAQYHLSLSLKHKTNNKTKNCTVKKQRETERERERERGGGGGGPVSFSPHKYNVYMPHIFTYHPCTYHISLSYCVLFNLRLLLDIYILLIYLLFAVHVFL